MQAVTVDRCAPFRLALHQVAQPKPCANELLIQVAAIALDRCEIERAMAVGAGARPGCDLAGLVVKSAEDGSGPGEGARVIGLVRSGAWAQYVAVGSNAVAEIPANVSIAQAATLPLSGLTALHGLGFGGFLAAKHVLVMSATQGVGILAVQIAHAGGAFVTASIDDPEHEALLQECGADHVVTTGTLAAAGLGAYHLVVDAVGGSDLSTTLLMLRKGGIYVACDEAGMPGAASEGHVRIADRGVRMHSVSLFDQLQIEPHSEGLQRLLNLVRTRSIDPLVEFEHDWTDISAATRRLFCQQHVGKAVLHLRSSAPRCRSRARQTAPA